MTPAFEFLALCLFFAICASIGTPIWEVLL